MPPPPLLVGDGDRERQEIDGERLLEGLRARRRR